MRTTPNASTVALAAAFLVAACTAGGAPASPRPAKAAPSDVDRILYELGRCRGFCPAYSFAIAADGNATFEGAGNTRIAGRAAVDATPTLFREIRDKLAAARPAESRSISHEACDDYATDQQQLSVTWEREGQGLATLSFDLGCHDARYAALRASLGAARKLFPIDGLIGRPTDF